MKTESLSAIFFRVANPVEPFGFLFVQDHALLALAGDIRNGLRELANLFDQLADGRANVFEKIHEGCLAPAGRRRSFR